LRVTGAPIALALAVLTASVPGWAYGLSQFWPPRFASEGSTVIVQFPDASLSGEVVYGPAAPGDAPYPVWRFRARLEHGTARLAVPVKEVFRASGRERRVGTLWLKVVVRGRPVFYLPVQVVREGGSVRVLEGSVVCGPLVYCPRPDGCVIWYRTLRPVVTEVVVLDEGGRVVCSVRDPRPAEVHRVIVRGLSPDRWYWLVVRWQGYELVRRRFRTAPARGASGFVFAFTADSRSDERPSVSNGTGDADAYGCNVWALQRAFAFAAAHGARFLVFPGDLIWGRGRSEDEIRLQYWNWLQAVSPWEPEVPVYLGYGNHEAYVGDERLFSELFVTPAELGQGPTGVSEGEGAPQYGDTVYYFRYGCVAVVMLNNCYTPDVRAHDYGFLRRRQLEWLDETLDELDRDPSARFVLVAMHVPPFRVAKRGWGVKPDHLEDLNRLLEVLMRHRKVVAVLCGHDHCYARYLITRDFPMYPPGWSGRDIRREPWFRPLWVIINGNAGAPVYGLADNPWNGKIQAFRVAPAHVTLFRVQGDKLIVETYDAVTEELVDRFEIPAPTGGGPALPVPVLPVIPPRRRPS